MKPHPRYDEIMEPNLFEKISHQITKWIGSPTSIIVHTLLFALAFFLVIFGFAFERILLVVTTIVSLEAIYLSIFIQMSVNRNESRLSEVSEDIQEIQQDVEGIEHDVDEIQEDIEDIQEDIEEDDEDSKHLEQIKTTFAQLISELEAIKEHRKTTGKKK